MKVGKWVLGLAALGLIFIGTADAQTVNANTLCIHSGGGYYVNGPFYGDPNCAGGKYFPSFAHIPATSVGNAGVIKNYPWKIAGWAWIGMQANNFGSTWVWQNCLQYSVDNPYATTMSWDYPVLFCNGTLSPSGPPTVYGGLVPSSLPGIGSSPWLFPSSSGGWDAYMNIFAVGSGSWYIPSTLPFYGYEFGFIAPCASAITVPSGASIWQVHWVKKGPFGQYLVLSEEDDCAGHTWAGNKGRNYSLIWGNGYLWYWNNGGKGVGEEWAECLWVCDSILIPVNAPGYQSPSWNPFYNYGFDVGVATLTPYMSSGMGSLGFMAQAYDAPAGTVCIPLACFAFTPPIVYGPHHYRICGWDWITSLFASAAPLFAFPLAPGYPACMFGTTVGGNSLILPFPADSTLLCLELECFGYLTGGQPPTANYRVTWF